MSDDERDAILRDLADFDLPHHTVGDLRALVKRAKDALAGSATSTPRPYDPTLQSLARGRFEAVAGSATPTGDDESGPRQDTERAARRAIGEEL